MGGALGVDLGPGWCILQIGPRLTLQLVKVEEGLAQGEVLYHSFGERSWKVKEAWAGWVGRVLEG